MASLVARRDARTKESASLRWESRGGPGGEESAVVAGEAAVEAGDVGEQVCGGETDFLDQQRDLGPVALRRADEDQASERICG